MPIFDVINVLKLQRLATQESYSAVTRIPCLHNGSNDLAMKFLANGRAV
jgi:hypothetical protein